MILTPGQMAMADLSHQCGDRGTAIMILMPRRDGRLMKPCQSHDAGSPVCKDCVKAKGRKCDDQFAELAEVRVRDEQKPNCEKCGTRNSHPEKHFEIGFLYC